MRFVFASLGLSLAILGVLGIHPGNSPRLLIAEATSGRQAPGGEFAPAAAVQQGSAGAAVTVSSPITAWADDGIRYVFEGQEWDGQSVANVDAALLSLPIRVRGELGNRNLGGLSILVNRSGRTLAGKTPYGSAANFFSTNDGDNQVVLFPDQSPPTVLHELGHAYNLRETPPGRYALVLLQPEMQSFMAATGWRVLSTPEQVGAARDQTAVAYAYDGGFAWPRISHSDPLEDFANTFALYFSSPDGLQSQSPERFAWFEANVGQ